MATRRPIVAANWKMNKTPSETAGFFSEFLPKFGSECASDVVIVPPYTSLAKAAEALVGNAVVGLGAQNAHPGVACQPRGPGSQRAEAVFRGDR